MESLSAGDPWSVFTLCAAWAGVAVGVAFLAFSVRHYDHVVIRNSGRELSALAWVGVMVCHVNAVLVFLAFPSPVVCGLMR